MSKRKKKGLKSHLNTRSTAKLTKEIKGLLDQNIPDPQQPLDVIFESQAKTPEEEEAAKAEAKAKAEARERKQIERMVDSLDRQEENEARDEYSRRYQ